MEKLVQLLRSLKNNFEESTKKHGKNRRNLIIEDVRKNIVDIVKHARCNTELYKQLLDIIPFQEITQDRRFSVYLSEVSGNSNSEFIELKQHGFSIRGKPVGGPRISNTLIVFEFIMIGKFLEMLEYLALEKQIEPERQQVISEQQKASGNGKLNNKPDSKDLPNEQDIFLQENQKAIDNWVKWSNEIGPKRYEEAMSLLKNYSGDERSFMEIGVNQYKDKPKLLEYWIRIERAKFSREDNATIIYNLKQLIHDIDLFKTGYVGIVDPVIEKKNNAEFEFFKNCAERLIDQIEYESKQAIPTVYNSEKNDTFNIETTESLQIKELLSPAYKITTAGKFQKYGQYYYCPDCDGSTSENPGLCKYCNKTLNGDGTYIKDIDISVIPFLTEIRKKIALEDWTKDDVCFIEKVIRESERKDILDVAITVRNEMKSIMNSWDSDDPMYYNGGQSPEEFRENEKSQSEYWEKQAELVESELLHDEAEATTPEIMINTKKKKQNETEERKKNIPEASEEVKKLALKVWKKSDTQEEAEPLKCYLTTYGYTINDQWELLKVLNPKARQIDLAYITGKLAPNINRAINKK